MIPFLIQLLACGGKDPSDQPTLELLSPADGDTVCGAPLVVEMKVTNFTLTNEDIQDPPANTGHIHVYLNGQEVAQSAEETVDIKEFNGHPLTDGAYQLKADLALANHDALDPYVGVDPIYITVDTKACWDTAP